jgi:hypothetical protein
MEPSPSEEANSRSDSQEIPNLSWNPEIYYNVHRCGAQYGVAIYKYMSY